ncbi:DUF3566 domain-containing protein [Nocardioides marmoraquaticus]
MVQPDAGGQSGSKRPILPPPPPALADDERAASEKAAADRAAAEQSERDAAAAEQAKREAAEAKQAERDARAAERQRAREERQAAKSAATEQKARDKAARQEAARAQQAERERASQAAGVPSGQATRGRGAPPAPARRTRKAQLRLVQVDAWSVMKTSFLLSIALGIVLIVAVAIIWAVLGAAGVWDSVNSIVQQAVGNADGPQFDVTDYLGTSRVLGFTALVAALDVVLITAIATLGAFLYNLSAALLGGVEVTLAEDN